MQTVIAEVLSRKYIHFHTDIKVTYSKVKLCPGLPSSGGVPKVLEEQQGEGWRQKKSKGKKIQTLFLVKNPPQLHHMTSQKENATLLLPTPTSPPPNFIQLALISPPSPVLMSKTHPSDALHFTPTDTLRGLFPYICKCVNGNRHTAIATSPTPDVPSCKLCLPYRRKHDITNFSLYMKLGLSFFFFNAAVCNIKKGKKRNKSATTSKLLHLYHCKLGAVQPIALQAIT